MCFSLFFLDTCLVLFISVRVLRVLWGVVGGGGWGGGWGGGGGWGVGGGWGGVGGGGGGGGRKGVANDSDQPGLKCQTKC